MYAEPADREADQDADEQPPQGENPGAPPEGAFLRVGQVKNRAPAEVAKVLEHDVARDKEPEHRRWVHLGAHKERTVGLSTTELSSRPSLWKAGAATVPSPPSGGSTPSRRPPPPRSLQLL